MKCFVAKEYFMWHMSRGFLFRESGLLGSHGVRPAGGRTEARRSHRVHPAKRTQSLCGPSGFSRRGRSPDPIARPGRRCPPGGEAARQWVRREYSYGSFRERLREVLGNYAPEGLREK